ncbi:MAG TPA: PRC-barrel domain-containing protein [Anaerolineae bacterium]|nr:PRC-barrel domain-containing protein [Anaerolineae bacterium]
MALKRFSQMEKTGLKFEMDYPDLTGYNVFDKNGNDVGEVQDMLYDTNTGMVNHAIIGRGWLSSLLGERQVIVPFDRMTVSPTDKTIRLDIDRDELSRFPEWSVSEENLSDRIAGWWRETTRAA